MVETFPVIFSCFFCNKHWTIIYLLNTFPYAFLSCFQKRSFLFKILQKLLKFHPQNRTYFTHNIKKTTKRLQVVTKTQLETFSELIDPPKVTRHFRPPPSHTTFIRHIHNTHNALTATKNAHAILVVSTSTGQALTVSGRFLSFFSPTSSELICFFLNAFLKKKNVCFTSRYVRRSEGCAHIAVRERVNARQHVKARENTYCRAFLTREVFCNHFAAF